mmetsp:Transcript_13839/g.11808  ORF Transcript_13839/g.11808 Transcript_13839/m.11808 type:complete len:202 (-) Transcript_13839:879-1484(-)
MGPGAYDLNFKHTELRLDTGAVKYPDLNQNNDRINQVDFANHEVFDEGKLNVNYDPVLPKAPEYKIHEPVKLDGPAHIPESKVNPEHWRYYDVNLDSVKPKAPEAKLAEGGLTRDQFLTKEQKFEEFLKYRERKKKKPEIGQYEPSYKHVDKDEHAPDFKRYLDREMEQDEDKLNQDQPGDVLVLNPDRPKPHMPNIKFEN